MTTLITGASSGIGEAFARRLAAEGYDLFLVARSEDKLRDLCSELSAGHEINARYLAIDLTKPNADQRCFSETERLEIDVDLLINNAGFGSMGDFAKLDIERELDMIRLNIGALVGLTHRYLGPMRERRRGTIINISSGAGFQPIPFMATYAATKSFVTAFSEAIAAENRRFGIEVIAVCPGSTDTPFFDTGKVGREFAQKGLETPEQVVETALNAIGGGKAKVVSGWKNQMVARIASLIPNSLITRVIAKQLRKKYQDQ
ncbi:MAG: SDR family oxidoreductase [bacterium]|nr:SDR family oxidoreductase [bacterium]